jgi:hypothetical protein
MEKYLKTRGKYLRTRGKLLWITIKICANQYT